MIADQASRRRVGLFGGTFDPPHHGHVAAARAARRALDLAEVRLVVAGVPWMKQGWSDARHRLAMARLAVQDDLTGGDGLLVDDREVRREGPTYTVDTLEELLAEEPDVDPVLLLGWDAAMDLPHWHRCEDVLRLATVAVFRRPGAHGDLPDRVADRATHIRVPYRPISSTDLRRQHAAGSDISAWVAPGVLAYIREHGLYVAAS